MQLPAGVPRRGEQPALAQVHLQLGRRLHRRRLGGGGQAQPLHLEPARRTAAQDPGTAQLPHSSRCLLIFSASNRPGVGAQEGPKEGLLDLVWHPLRPTIASVSTSGQVFIWSTHHTESWSAFAPDFKELEENEEYEEREDEFDAVDVTKVEQKKEDEEAEDVDIMTIEKIGAFSSDSENELFYLPTVPERDPEADADFEGGGASGGATPGSDRKEKGRGAGGAAAKRKGKGKGGGAKRAKTQAAKAKKGAVRSPTTERARALVPRHG